MSALMVDEWMRPVACPQLVVVPQAVKPVAGPRPTTRVTAGGSRAQAGGLRLTRRGIAAILGLFVALMVTSVVVLVTSFLAVSNGPVVAGTDAGVVASVSIP